MPKEYDWNCEAINTERLDSTIDKELLNYRRHLCELAVEAMNGDRNSAEHLEFAIERITNDVANKMGFNSLGFLYFFISQQVKMKIMNKIMPVHRTVGWIEKQAKEIAKMLSNKGAKEITITGNIVFASIAVTFDVESLKNNTETI